MTVLSFGGRDSRWMCGPATGKKNRPEGLGKETGEGGRSGNGQRMEWRSVNVLENRYGSVWKVKRQVHEGRPRLKSAVLNLIRATSKRCFKILGISHLVLVMNGSPLQLSQPLGFSWYSPSKINKMERKNHHNSVKRGGWTADFQVEGLTCGSSYVTANDCEKTNKQKKHSSKSFLM